MGIIADITRFSQNANPAAAQFPADARERGLVAPGQNQITVLMSQGAGDGKSDATCSAGYQRDFAAEGSRRT